ncbi:MAG: response regulator [Candidatus Natronoplasma sp.]
MSKKRSEKKKVLFVDDNKLLRTQTKINLENSEHGFEVRTASNVREALELIEKDGYRAIISDYLMEERDGLDLLEEVRKEKEDLPFIMFTGKGDEDVAQRALNLGADRYIKKKGDAKSQYDKLAEALLELIGD